MSAIEKLFVWAGGYTPRNLESDAPEDREAVGKLGGTVLFAAAVAMLNWAVGAYGFAGNASPSVRAIAVVVAAGFAVAVVVQVDRVGLYFLDTIRGGAVLATLWVTFRIVLVLAISSFSTQVVLPLVLRSELQAHALQLQESSESARYQRLNSQFGLSEKQRVAEKATAHVTELESEAKHVPQEVQAKLTAATRCWSDYRQQRNSLLRLGKSEGEVHALLIRSQAQCSQKTRAAQAAKDVYHASMQAKLSDAVSKRQAAQAELLTTKNEVTSRLKYATSVEREAVNPQSATVLWSLLWSDRGSRIKWAVFMLFTLGMELMPLLTKLLAGKSVIGRRIGNNREIADLLQRERLTAVQHDVATASAISSMMQGAVVAACSGQNVHEFCVRMFAAKLSAFAPIEVVRSLLREIESKQFDVDRAVRRHPRYAASISQAWSQAVREAVDLLRSDRRPESTNVSELHTQKFAA